MKENFRLKLPWDKREQVTLAGIKTPKRAKPLTDNFG